MTQVLLSGDEDLIAIEEKRRAFWVAYCLDRFISVHNELPLTLNEEVVSLKVSQPVLVTNTLTLAHLRSALVYPA